MPVEVILPKVDMDMTHGTLAVWHLAEGESVVKGAPLFDIETDKAAMEVEAPATGRLHRVTARPGDKVAVGTVVALIYAEGEAMDAVPVAVAAPKAAPAPAVAGADPSAAFSLAESPTENPVAAGIRATPAARTAARQHGVALGNVPGTGPRGRIQRADVTAWVDTAVPAVFTAAPMAWAPQPGPLHISHRTGTGTPLVLIHGLTADSQSWAPLEKALAPSRPLIRIDLPGHGRSPRRKLHSFAELARMIVEAFDAATRNVDKVHLLGHSLGGALALAIADIRPRKAASLALLAPAGLGPEIDAAALGGIIRASRTESLGPWLRRLTATPDGIGDDYVRAAMKLRTDPALRAVQADMADLLFPDGVQGFDLRPAFGRVGVPTCLIWGRQDHILPYRQALAVDGDFAMHLLAGAGHIPQLECPERVAQIVSRHLAASDALA